MTITTYGHIGTALFWIGMLVMLVSICLFVMAGKGISIDHGGGLDSHDTYYIIVDLGHRLMFLVPFIAGLLLTFSGLFIRSQAPAIRAGLQAAEQEIQEQAQ